MVDVSKILKDVVNKGKVTLGEKQTKTAVKDGKAKLVVIANNCRYSSELSTMAKKKQIPLYEYESTSVNLGYACGKNFAVSSFAVLDEGDTNILHLIKKRK